MEILELLIAGFAVAFEPLNLTLVIFGWYLVPSIRYYTMDASERSSDAPSVTNIRKGAMKLGLDLQGGSYLVYEVDVEKIPVFQLQPLAVEFTHYGAAAFRAQVEGQEFAFGFSHFSSSPFARNPPTGFP